MTENPTIDDVLSEGPGPFESRPTHSQAGDCVELYFEDADHYAERVDCWLTVFKAFDDRRLIGFQIKNVASLLSRFDKLDLNCRVSGTKWTIRLFAFISCIAFTEPRVSSNESYLDIAKHVLNSNQAFELASS